jgi:hypothetical protein
VCYKVNRLMITSLIKLLFTGNGVTPSWSSCSSTSDALPSHGVKPTWGFHKVKLRKVELGSTLPASNSRKR